ncbi:hypothetical protein EFL64_10050 [Weissella cibaria]|uniref:DUF6731 family protein n=1 Tax=Weissella cibaria TaxID=137591 RepID=UPI00223B9358|nr:DUF6731 family protein [Weissella cibaria]MCT0958131.1 hypothetical protein [Weissella cibaria]
MVNRNKDVKFVYVQPNIQVDGREGLFDMNEWILEINKLKKTNPDAILMEYDGDIVSARNASIEGIGGTEYGVIHFVRYRMERPAVAKMTDEEFDVLKLDDDTFTVEDFSVLFDRQLGVAMVQKNKFAFIASVMSQYVTEVRQIYRNSPDDGQIEFRPVINKHAFDALKSKNAYKSLELKTANIAKVQSPLLKGLFNSQKAPEGVNITFSMSVGQSKTKQLPREFVDEVIEEVKTEFDSLSFASVSAGKTAETKKKTLKIVETDPINLLQGKIGDKKRFNLGESNNNHLVAAVVQTEMADLFSKKRAQLIKNVATNIVMPDTVE